MYKATSAASTKSPSHMRHPVHCHFIVDLDAAHLYKCSWI